MDAYRATTATVLNTINRSNNLRMKGRNETKRENSSILFVKTNTGITYLHHCFSFQETALIPPVGAKKKTNAPQ